MYTENIITTMDEIAKITIKRYFTDWTEYDRQKAIELVLKGEPFVFIPRECGCYLVHADQNEHVRKAIFEQWISLDGTKTLEGAKYYAISPDGYDEKHPFGGEIVNSIKSAKEIFDYINLNNEED